MTTQQLLAYGYFLLLASSVSGCIGGVTTEPLAGRYAVGFSEDGESGFYFDDPQLGITLLEGGVGAAGVVKGYAVCCTDSCYLYPAAAVTAKDARRTRVGPFTEAACQQRIIELTGDSLQLKRISI